MGRWINSDDPGVLTEVQINLFAYCYNNSVNYVDPTGYGAVLRAAPVCPSGVLTAIKLTKWNRSYYVDYFSSTWKSGCYQVYSFTSNPSNSHFTIYIFWVRVNSYKDWITYLEKEYGWIGSLDQWFEDTLDLIGEAGDIIPQIAFISSVISYALNILTSYSPREMKYILKMLNKYKGNEKTIYIVFFMDQISMSAKRKYWLWGPIVGWNRNLLFSQVKPY